jgi:malate dehydrogenase (oxaloacetate-decarboxylating)
MAHEQKLIRTVRVLNEQAVGVLASLMSAISDEAGSVGDIRMITETSSHVVRDITVYADDLVKIESIIEAMRRNPGTKIMAVRDEVLQLHEKGKIAIRSRYKIDSMETLRRVYTPGVAEVCMKIAKDPSLARLYTSTSHMVAIVTDGTAVLGLGDIGPLAAMPVMEGKAMLMESLVGLSGMPILSLPSRPLLLPFSWRTSPLRAASRSRNACKICLISLSCTTTSTARRWSLLPR